MLQCLRYNLYSLERLEPSNSNMFSFTEHSSSLDVDATNKKFLTRTEELWDSIETSGWWLEDKNEGIFDNKMINGK